MVAYFQGKRVGISQQAFSANNTQKLTRFPASLYFYYCFILFFDSNFFSLSCNFSLILVKYKLCNTNLAYFLSVCPSDSQCTWTMSFVLFPRIPCRACYLISQTGGKTSFLVTHISFYVRYSTTFGCFHAALLKC